MIHTLKTKIGRFGTPTGHNSGRMVHDSGSRDYTREYTTRNLQVILLFSMFGFAIIVAIGLLSGWKITTVICILACVATYLLLQLTKSGRVNSAGFLTCLLIIVTVNASVFTGEGFRDEASLIYPALIIIASLLLNRILFILATSISIGCFMFIGLGEIHGLIINELSSMTTYSAVAIAIIILIVTAIAVRLLNQNLIESIERSRASELQVRSLFNSNPNGIILFSLDGVVREVNRPLLDMTGYPKAKIIGMQFEDLVAGSSKHGYGGFSNILESIKDHYRSMEAELTKKDGTALPVIIKGWIVKDSDGAPEAIGAFINDISVEKSLSQEKEFLRQQLQHAQKIEAIGTLAGGISHDINNILSGIMGYAELAMITPHDDRTEMKRYMGEILKAGERTKELISQILKFSRQDAGELQATWRSQSAGDELHFEIDLGEIMGQSGYSLQSQLQVDIGSREDRPRQRGGRVGG